MKEYTVRAARKRREMTQTQLAEASGLDQTTISDLETGRHTNPRYDTIKRLAEALGIRPVQLLFQQPQPDATVKHNRDREGQTRTADSVRPTRVERSAL